MLVLRRRRRRFHGLLSSLCSSSSSSSRSLSTGASSPSLANLFRFGHQSGSCNTDHHRRQRKQRPKQQSFIFSKWCERSKISAPVVCAIIRREPKCRQDSEFSGSVVFCGLLMKGQVIDKDAADVLIEMAESGVFPSVAIQLSQLIGKLCRSGFVGKAWDFFHAVKRGGGLVGTSCCNTLLTGLHKDKDFARMNLLFSEMKDWGVQPDEFTHGVLLDHLCKSNRVEDARKLLDKMVMRTPSSVVLCNTVINGLCKEGRLEDGMKLLSEMMHKYSRSPNTVTYNCLINGYCKLGDIDMANRLLARMKDEGVPLNIITVNTLIDGMCRTGKIGSALDFFREQCLANAHLSGNAVTYSTLIGAFLNAENISKAMELYDEMLRRGHKPDIVMYGVMISGLSAAGGVERAYSIASQMRNEGFPLDVRCYNILISGFSKKNSPDKVRELLDEMETAGLKPDGVTYNTLISSSTNTGDISTANRLLNDMVSCGYKPTVVTYGALIHGHCTAGEFDEAMEIFRSMSETGIRPNNVIYSILISYLSNEKNVGDAVSLLDEMRAGGVAPDTTTYNAVFKCLYHRNSLDDAYELMNTMKEEGCKPNYLTLKILAEWFSSVGEIDRLKRFIHGNAFVDSSDAYNVKDPPRSHT